MLACETPAAAAVIEDTHRMGNATPAASIDRDERAAAHDAARANRARRDAHPLERQHARGREEGGRIDGEKAHVCARQEVAQAVANRRSRSGRNLLGQGHARHGRG